MNSPNEQKNDSDLTNSFGPGTTASFVVNSGQIINNIGAGYYPMATAGNLVWEDSNFDGIQDDAEPKVANVVVEAFDENNVKFGEAITNNEGTYTIDYLGKASYYLKFTPPVGYGITLANNSSEDSDSDVDHSFGLNTTRLYAMQPGVHYINIDAGLAFGALPVRYTTVKASFEGSYNQIKWQTVSEINADKFVIERLEPHARDFTAIGEVKASGNSARKLDYSFDDKDLEQDGNYAYRLAQVDFDGHINYSKVVEVAVKRAGASETKIFPNPTSDKFFIEMAGMSNGEEVLVELISSTGKLVYSETRFYEGTIQVNVKGLAKGVYYVNLTSNAQKESKKLIVTE